MIYIKSCPIFICLQLFTRLQGLSLDTRQPLVITPPLCLTHPSLLLLHFPLTRTHQMPLPNHFDMIIQLLNLVRVSRVVSTKGRWVDVVGDVVCACLSGEGGARGGCEGEGGRGCQ